MLIWKCIHINGKSNAICFKGFSSFNVLGPYPFALELSCKIAIKRKTKLPTNVPRSCNKIEGLHFLIGNVLLFVTQILKDGLSAVHVPYSYGFAIILLTLIVKAATLPLTKQQVSTNYSNFYRQIY